MKRRDYNNKELDLLDKLKKENQSLKKTVSTLRKQIARINLDQFENVKNVLDKHDALEIQEELSKEKQRLKEKWRCHSCQEGYLKINMVDRRDGMFYYRKCTECNNRTPTKKYNEKVEGLKE